jgi:hypothetical protein
MRQEYKNMLCAAPLTAIIVFAATFGAWSGDKLNRPSAGSLYAKQQNETDSAADHENAQNRQYEPKSPRDSEYTQFGNRRGAGADTQEEGDWYTKPDWWVAGFTGALFFATFGLWIFTGLLWQATKTAVMDESEAIRLSKGQFVATNRPFVFLKEIKTIFDRPPDDHPQSGSGQLMAKMGMTHHPIRSWTLLPIWENSGNTPTKSLIVNFCCHELKNELPLDNILPDTGRPSRSLIGPHSSITSEGKTLDGALINRLRDGQDCFIYVWGWAEYNDEFEGTERHRTEFCFRVVHTGVDRDGYPIMLFPMHTYHNAYDNECSRPPTPYKANPNST